MGKKGALLQISKQLPAMMIIAFVLSIVSRSVWSLVQEIQAPSCRIVRSSCTLLISVCI